jgi:thiamine-phosphate pyrophosphorylase
MSDKNLYELIRKCRPVADRFGVLLMVDDRVDLALAAGADGVHLGQDDMPLQAARQIAPELFIGNSTHNVEEALAAFKAGADCINVGPIYPTQTKQVNCGAVGLQMIADVTSKVDLPFSVMGGIKMHRFGELLNGGAQVLAMVTEITTAPDVCAKVKELRAEYARCRNNG